MIRARELGIRIGRLEPGPLDTITDVAGVRVGWVTLVEGDDVRTGVTVVVPDGVWAQPRYRRAVRGGRRGDPQRAAGGAHHDRARRGHRARARRGGAARRHAPGVLGSSAMIRRSRP
ncbi:MAG: P1 family peptidase [Solirubrobacteraceae bacterium]